MMWKAKAKPKEGDVRVRRKFAWWPMQFLVDTELYYVWLETYEATEQYSHITVNYGEGHYKSKLRWEVIKREPLYWVIW